MFKDGNLVYHYKGQFRNGVEHGKGVIYQDGGTFTGSLRKGKKWSGKTVFDNGSIRLYEEGERVKVKVTEATAASEFFSFMHAPFVVFINQQVPPSGH